jgi:hypothetical protein
LNGVLSYNDQHAHLRSKLSPGKYIVYVKLDPTLKNANFPKQTSLVIYSSQFARIKPSLQQNYPNLLRNSFLAHGRRYKRQLYNNDLMWSSWKLMAQGGYAYIALGNSISSKNKFVVAFKES